MKLLIFIFVNIGGYIGWEVGEPYGVTPAFLGGSVGSILGVYVGWKLARWILE